MLAAWVAQAVKTSSADTNGRPDPPNEAEMIH